MKKLLVIMSLIYVSLPGLGQQSMPDTVKAFTGRDLVQLLNELELKRPDYLKVEAAVIELFRRKQQEWIAEEKKKATPKDK